MVTDIESSDTARDRGQLVLISALAIAFILLGVVVVFNSVQYTQTIDSGSAGESMADVPMTEQQLESGVEGLIEQYNATELNSSTTALESDIEEFAEQYGDARAHQRPVSVDIDVTSVSVPNVLDPENTITVKFVYEYRTANVAKNGEISVDVHVEEML